MAKWITHPEALERSGVDSARLTSAGRDGDVTGRVRYEDGAVKILEPCWWRWDWDGGRLDVARLGLYQRPLDGRPHPPPKPRFLPVEIDEQTLLQTFGKAAKAPRQSGGRPHAIPPEALIEVSAWLHATGIPDKLVDVENKLREAITAAGAAEPGETTVRNWANRIIDAHRRALRSET
jgi:hypothetical protein